MNINMLVSLQSGKLLALKPTIECQMKKVPCLHGAVDNVEMGAIPGAIPKHSLVLKLPGLFAAEEAQETHREIHKN